MYTYFPAAKSSELFYLLNYVVSLWLPSHIHTEVLSYIKLSANAGVFEDWKSWKYRQTMSIPQKHMYEMAEMELKFILM